ncbi:MAG: MmgE/PrpD family protein [Anaerolineae bacterium]|nr:MmgE/PrpD family protein [Anaerolineae bacterium]
MATMLQEQPRIASRETTAEVARYIADLRFADLNSDVVRQARLILLDTLGALLAASPSRYSAGRILAQFAEMEGGTPECSLIGRTQRTSAVHAALVNGTLGYYCDVEAHHPAAILHAPAIMVPASLAIAEREHQDGQSLLTALVLGVDLACRVSNAIDPTALYRRGFHPTAVAGGFGSAAAAASLLRLGVKQVRNMLGLVGTQASGLLAWEQDDTENSRPFNPGIACRNGVTAALLAGLGFGGPPDIFEGKFHLFGAFSENGQGRLAELTGGLGEKFAIMELAIKLYSCCAFLHPGLDGLLNIMDTHELTGDDIAEMTLRFPPSGVQLIDNNRLRSHCGQYILPIAALERKIIIDDILFDRRSEPAIQALTQHTQVIGDPALDQYFPDRYTSIIEVTTRDGEHYAERIDWAKGTPENPVTEAELKRKFHSLADPVAGPERACRIAEMVDRIEDVADVGELTALLSFEQGE